MNMSMENLESLEKRIAEEKLEREMSVLTLLFDASREVDAGEDAHSEADYKALYAAMEGMPMEEMDRLLYLITMLGRNQEKAGFIRGIKVGMRLRQELG